MKYSYLLILLVAILAFNCSSDSDGDDPDADCDKLQLKVDTATLMKIEALELYTKAPSDQARCINYKEALEYRIERIQALIDSECTDLFTGAYLEEVIKEDEEEIGRLDC